MAQSNGTAAVLSFVVPGLGQIYKGQIFNGLVWLVAVVAGYACFVVPGLVLHICCVIGASRQSGVVIAQFQSRGPVHRAKPHRSGSGRALIQLLGLCLIGLGGYIFWYRQPSEIRISTGLAGGGLLLLILAGFSGPKRKRSGYSASTSRAAQNLEMMSTTDWQDDPVTERQMELADDLGIRYSSRDTKGSLSAKISAKLGK